jgi:hypothetical protein
MCMLVFIYLNICVAFASLVPDSAFDPVVKDVLVE